jgi:hypothetical protein
MNTNELVKHLQNKYPELMFSSDSPKNLGLEDVLSKEELKLAPKKIISFISSGDISMWDAYCSECSRFKVSPTDYGISEEDGKLMLEHNKVSIHGVYDEVMNGKSEKSKKIKIK